MEPEFLTEDMIGKVVSGNLYAEYYGSDVIAAAAGDPLRAYATCDRALFQVGLTSTVTASVSGGSRPYRFYIEPFRRLPDSTDIDYWSFGVSSSSNTLSITPENIYQYAIRFTVTAANGDYVQFNPVYETVTPDSLSDPTTIGGKIREVIADEIKPGMSDREKALAIHEWLTHNAYYDHTKVNHGPDGVLLKGTGVCESYARAYQMFMSELGIPTVYISADSINHAWNMIYVDGGWYHVDVTWDDPGDSTEPVSGLENTMYFCMTDEEIGRDHTWNDYGLSAPVSGKGSIYPDPETEIPPAQDTFLGENRFDILERGLTLLRFTAPEDGRYTFETIGDKDTIGHLYDEKMNQAAESEHGGSKNNFAFCRSLSKGQVIYIGAEYSTDNESGTETLLIRYVTDVFVGSNTIRIEPGKATMLGFQAPEDGVYIFETVGDSNIAGTLYNSNMVFTASDHDSGRNQNFRLSASLTKGQLVLIGAEYYGSTGFHETETLQITWSAPGAPTGALANTMLTLNGRVFNPMMGKPTLLLFVSAGGVNSTAMLRELAGYDLSAMNVVIADCGGNSAADCKAYFAENAAGITGAVIAYDAESYLLNLLEYIGLDPEKINTPFALYFNANYTPLIYTTGYDNAVVSRIESRLGVRLEKTDFAGNRLKLPDSTISIGPEALRGTAAQLIEIPAGCTSIANDAFKDCAKLKIILNHSALSITPPSGVVVTDIPAN